MGLKVMDGARTIDGANAGADIWIDAYTAATVNAASIDMSGHDELLVCALTGTLTGTGTGVVFVQESNDDSTFTNIASAIVSFAADGDNTAGWLSIDWTHPDRKRYARLVHTVANNTVELGALTLRVRHKQAVTADDALTAI